MALWNCNKRCYRWRVIGFRIYDNCSTYTIHERHPEPTQRHKFMTYKVCEFCVQNTLGVHCVEKKINVLRILIAA